MIRCQGSRSKSELILQWYKNPGTGFLPWHGAGGHGEGVGTHAMPGRAGGMSWACGRADKTMGVRAARRGVGV